ncbi:MAG TPA: SDR family oxidoreductase [Bryobacteraceae bacterium]|nr:SDR family oxidoreductase [Bryobacteraceae bacterium]
MPGKNTEKSSLLNKVAVVTGGTRGIGRAIVERLLSEGVKVAFCGTRRESVDEAMAELSSHGDAMGKVADVSKLDQVKRFVAAVMDRFGGVDILINNAGAGVFRSVAELTPEEWDRTIALNLSGVYYCCHEILPILINKHGGDIINISSLAAKNPFAGGAGYNASKFGLNGFSEAMMLDHRSDGVRVSSIMPGSVATEFGGHGADTGADWKIAPEDIAEVVVTLLKMPARTNISRVEIRPSQPPRKA